MNHASNAWFSLYKKKAPLQGGAFLIENEKLKMENDFSFLCHWVGGAMGARYSGGKSDQSEWPRSAEEEGFSKPTMLTGTATGAVGTRGNPHLKKGILRLVSLAQNDRRM